ncbi:hypothetical protein D3C87_2058960 [compost metagenome]
MSGIGTLRNSAATANQSASAPTMAASDTAFTQSTAKLRGRNAVTIKTRAAAARNSRAVRLDFLSSSSLFIPSSGLALLYQ